MLTDLEKQLITEELKRTGGNYSKVSRLLGIDYELLKAEYNVPETRDLKRPSGPIPEDIQSLGKPGLQFFVVAVKRDGDDVWPDRFTEAIEKARIRYDNGTHEMCQGLHQDGWVVLYCIPRRKPVEYRPYFASMF